MWASGGGGHFSDNNAINRDFYDLKIQFQNMVFSLIAGRLVRNSDLKLTSVGQCLMFVLGWTHRDSNRGFH